MKRSRTITAPPTVDESTVGVVVRPSKVLGYTGRASLQKARHRCAQALDYLADEATAGRGSPLIESLASWLPALDMELLALRRQTREEPRP